MKCGLEPIASRFAFCFILVHLVGTIRPCSGTSKLIDTNQHKHRIYTLETKTNHLVRAFLIPACLKKNSNTNISLLYMQHMSKTCASQHIKKLQ